MEAGRRINIEVEYLGFIVKLTGKKEETFTLEGDFGLQTLLQSILNRYQPTSLVRDNIIMAVNKKIVHPDGEKRFLFDGDRVSIGLKISGG